MFDSMSRSAALTKGNRWRILGLWVIFVIAIWILQVALALAAAAVISVLGNVLGAVLLALVSAVSSVIASIASAVAYVELRYVKEGTDVKELAEIFA